MRASDSAAGLPNFFVIGAMKAGTTTLWRLLSQHPDIFMPQMKEPQFFSERANADWQGPDPRPTARLDEAAYRALFVEAGAERARGEATPVYLCDPVALERIRRDIPAARLIAILRQPVDRAYSAWLMKCRQGWERLAFEDALAEEPRRIEQEWRHSWHYAALGRYRGQLERCYRVFDRAQVKVVLFDDLVRDAHGLVRELYRFLDVDESFIPEMLGTRNAAFLVRSPGVHRWMTLQSPLREQAKRVLPTAARRVWSGLTRTTRALNTTSPPRLAPDVRARLTREWRGEILALEDVIGRNLAHWHDD
jgi:hypothetical protein